MLPSFCDMPRKFPDHVERHIALQLAARWPLQLAGEVLQAVVGKVGVDELTERLHHPFTPVKNRW